jgi:hypothetical protein
VDVVAEHYPPGPAASVLTGASSLMHLVQKSLGVQGATPENITLVSDILARPATADATKRSPNPARSRPMVQLPMPKFPHDDLVEDMAPNQGPKPAQSAVIVGAGRRQEPSLDVNCDGSGR